jgi:hypothetical protein
MVRSRLVSMFEGFGGGRPSGDHIVVVRYHSEISSWVLRLVSDDS